jgi:predicted DNA binding protein
MSTIAEFAIEPGEFLLGGVVEDVPDLSIELERIVPLGRQVMPYLWCHTQDQSSFEAVLREQSNVDDVVVLERVDDAALYRIEWAVATDSIVEGLRETDGTLLEATAEGTWRVRVLFETHRDVREFHRYLTRRNVSYALERMYSITDDATDSVSSLTDEQRAALLAAAKSGYFRVPRESTMADIGHELDISEQATSERIRRGVDALLADRFASELEPSH